MSAAPGHPTASPHPHGPQPGSPGDAAPLRFERLAVIGCGLMGGSFALALRQAGLVAHTVGHSASASSRAKALALGVVDSSAERMSDAVAGADIVLLAVPVGAMVGCFAELARLLRPDALLMDVGSTKADVLAAAQAHLGDRIGCFVPAHPIAGKELAGVEHAEAALFRDRLTVLTPTPDTGAAQLAQARAVWRAIGSHLRELSPAQHDAAYAAVSHLPHLLAFAYINAIAEQPDAERLLSLAGPGFRDFSRIAASDPAVWRDILLANRTEVLAQTARLRQALDTFEAPLRASDGAALQALIAQARDTRAGWQLSPPLRTD